MSETLPPSPAETADAAEKGELALRDAARGAGLKADELAEQRAVAIDRSRPLEERLEAFEDILDSEIGDTGMVRARNLERESGLRQLWVKFDGGNPTGTQKDRIAFAQARDALRRGFDTLTVATCGNYGAALSLAASMAGLGCRVYIPAPYHTRRLVEMEAQGARVERVEGDYEAAVGASRRAAETEDLYDANPGGANVGLQLDAYAEIAYEIYDELRDAPAAVAVPVSNGTTLAGIHKGFVRLYRRGRTSRVPRMVAGSSAGKNPIIRAWVRGLARCEDLDPSVIRETTVNEPLINWHSFDGDAALDAVRDSGGWAGYASDRAMLRQARLLKEHEGLSVLPASTAGLAVLLSRQKEEALPGDRYVAVLTGRR
jgi:threonine synthase